MRRLIAAVALTLTAISWALAEQLQLPNAPGSVKFAVIGDNGTGERPQYELGARMAASRAAFRFAFVIMLGDNMYGRQEPEDFVKKFERPYARLLSLDMPFYAVLGNHDKPTNRYYKPFNMGGERYYTFVKGHVRFFMFDTNLLDPEQLEWLEEALRQSRDQWKIACFHHPLYSDARRHGSNTELRVVLEPLFVRHGVNVALAGHDHVYMRMKPQKGITHFVEGSSGQLRTGDLKWSSMTAAGFDEDQTFMLVEISGERMLFQTISRAGRLVDSGVVERRPST
jgi:3',5'-cyclic AMP phosphodiesterase CpdA